MLKYLHFSNTPPGDDIVIFIKFDLFKFRTFFFIFTNEVIFCYVPLTWLEFRDMIGLKMSWEAVIFLWLLID